ncbi:MAG: hypothetical protein DRG33_06030 [Deltaproteobacteria bacterium]|nr:MAG: hypothetical protein DRG33_06030 [Deltaproteobacteria bacterium]
MKVNEALSKLVAELGKDLINVRKIVVLAKRLRSIYIRIEDLSTEDAIAAIRKILSVKFDLEKIASRLDRSEPEVTENFKKFKKLIEEIQDVNSFLTYTRDNTELFGRILNEFGSQTCLDHTIKSILVTNDPDFELIRKLIKTAKYTRDVLILRELKDPEMQRLFVAKLPDFLRKIYRSSTAWETKENILKHMDRLNATDRFDILSRANPEFQRELLKTFLDGKYICEREASVIIANSPFLLNTIRENSDLDTLTVIRSAYNILISAGVEPGINHLFRICKVVPPIEKLITKRLYSSFRYILKDKPDLVENSKRLSLRNPKFLKICFEIDPSVSEELLEHVVTNQLATESLEIVLSHYNGTVPQRLLEVVCDSGNLNLLRRVLRSPSQLNRNMLKKVIDMLNQNLLDEVAMFIFELLNVEERDSAKIRQL